MYPVMERDGERVRPAADELPAPHHDLRVRAALLPRAADPHRRDRRHAPLGEVRAAHGHEPRAHHDAQRRAHLLRRHRAGGARRSRASSGSMEYVYGVLGPARTTATGSRWATRDDKEKYVDNPRDVGDGRGAAPPRAHSASASNSTEAKGEAAFYGPKIDVQFKTAPGKTRRSSRSRSTSTCPTSSSSSTSARMANATGRSSSTAACSRRWSAWSRS